MWQSSNTIRTGHDVSHSALLPGGQYARGRERSLSTRRRISLWLQGSLFCTAKGSHFVFWGLRMSCKAGLGVAA